MKCLKKRNIVPSQKWQRVSWLDCPTKPPGIWRMGVPVPISRLEEWSCFLTLSNDRRAFVFTKLCVKANFPALD